MSEPILCKICGRRRARRYCPAVHGEICTICCGTEREVSLLCPLDCEYLQEAHRHEKPIDVAESRFSKLHASVKEEFLHEHERTLLFCAHALLDAALNTPGAVDSDVLEALEALIQTRQTLASGLVYETRPENRVAAGIQREFNSALDEYETEIAKREAFAAPGNSEILTILAFLHWAGELNRNGRPRGRMFMDALRKMVPEARVEERTPSIII
jgi:hypothetical protein